MGEASSTKRHQGDIVSPEKRSRMMATVKQKDTRAELAVRRILKSLGIHYRIRNRDLPGSPDIANRSRGWAIFVNGCFWHGHRNCPRTKGGRVSRVPVSNRSFWEEKLVANRKRDARKCRQLRQAGFKVVIIWECQLSEPERLGKRLSSTLSGGIRARKTKR